MSAVVYRMFDANGALLYIGSTANLEKRFRSHFDYDLGPAARIAGCDELRARYASHTVAEHPDLSSARAAERAAIRDEAPELNRAFNRSRFRWTGRGFVPAAPAP